MRFDNHLGGADTRYFLLQRHLRLVCVELGHGKFGGSDIDIGYAYRVAPQDHACEKIVAFGSQHGWIDYGARGDDAQDFAVYQPF